MRFRWLKAHESACTCSLAARFTPGDDALGSYTSFTKGPSHGDRPGRTGSCLDHGRALISELLVAAAAATCVLSPGRAAIPLCIFAYARAYARANVFLSFVRLLAFEWIASVSLSRKRMKQTLMPVPCGELLFE